jgi:hypothetical protein
MTLTLEGLHFSFKHDFNGYMDKCVYISTSYYYEKYLNTNQLNFIWL